MYLVTNVYSAVGREIVHKRMQQYRKVIWDINNIFLMPSTECMSSYFCCFLLVCINILHSINIRACFCRTTFVMCRFISKTFWSWDHFIMLKIWVLIASYDKVICYDLNVMNSTISFSTKQ